MNKSYKFLLIGIAVATAFSIAYYFGLSQYLSLEYVQLKASILKQHAVENYLSTVVGYLVLFTTLIAFGLPVTAPLGVLGGFLFGTIFGFLYAMIIVCVGATISFLMIRRTLSQVVRIQYKNQLDSFNTQINQYGYSYIITLHLLSVVPYFLINTLAALSNIPLTTFMWTTFVGAIPSVFIYVFAGKQLYEIKAWGDILSWHMLIILGLLALLSLMPMIVRRFHNAQRPGNS